MFFPFLFFVLGSVLSQPTPAYVTLPSNQPTKFDYQQIIEMNPMNPMSEMTSIPMFQSLLSFFRPTPTRNEIPSNAQSCSVYTGCPTGFNINSNNYYYPNQNITQVCCVSNCLDYQCPTGYVLNQSNPFYNEEIESRNKTEVCCIPLTSCNLYSACSNNTYGNINNVNVTNYYNSSDDDTINQGICCVQNCNNIDCPASYEKNQSVFIYNNTQNPNNTCCRPLSNCTQYTCNSTTHLTYKYNYQSLKYKSLEDPNNICCGVKLIHNTNTSSLPTNTLIYSGPKTNKVDWSYFIGTEFGIFFTEFDIFPYLNTNVQSKNQNSSKTLYNYVNNYVKNSKGLNLNLDYSKYINIATYFSSYVLSLSSPTMLNDVVYVGSMDMNVYAIHSSGSLVWKFFIDSPMITKPIVDKNDNLIVSSLNKLFSIDSQNGTLLWQKSIDDIDMYPSLTSSYLGPDGTIYVGNTNNLYGFDSNGTLVFNMESSVIGGSIVSTSTGDDGSMYIVLNENSIMDFLLLETINEILKALTENKIVAFDPNGNMKWNMTVSNPLANPVVFNNTLFVTNSVQTLQALNAENGTLLWSYSLSNYIFDNFFTSQKTIGPDGTIYVGVSNDIYAINSQGSLLWNYTTENFVLAPPAIDKNNNVYFGSIDYHVYALSSRGSLIWKSYTGGPILSKPLITEDALYVNSIYLIAFKNYTTICPSIPNPNPSPNPSPNYCPNSNGVNPLNLFYTELITVNIQISLVCFNSNSALNGTELNVLKNYNIKNDVQFYKYSKIVDYVEDHKIKFELGGRREILANNNYLPPIYNSSLCSQKLGEEYKKYYSKFMNNQTKINDPDRIMIWLMYSFFQ